MKFYSRRNIAVFPENADAISIMHAFKNQKHLRKLPQISDHGIITSGMTSLFLSVKFVS